MTIVFADTSFYVALLSSRDALHNRAVQFLGCSSWAIASGHDT
jgi:predicted nucleic acid-binding protein